MKKINKANLPYRQGVLGLIINDRHQILLINKPIYQLNEWNYPGGGIDPGETVEAALLRELREELGTDKFQLVTQNKKPIEYDWPDEVIERRLRDKGELFRGQQQQVFLVKFIGNEEDLKPDPEEIRQVKWVSRDELSEYLLFPGQPEEAKRLLAELLPD